MSLKTGIFVFLMLAVAFGGLDSATDQVAAIDGLATALWDSDMVNYLHAECSYNTAELPGLYTPYGEKSAKRVANMINLSCAHYATYKAGNNFNQNKAMAYTKSAMKTLAAVYPIAKYMFSCDINRECNNGTDCADEVDRLQKFLYYAKSGYENRRWLRDYFLEKYRRENAGGAMTSWETEMDTLCEGAAITLASFFA